MGTKRILGLDRALMLICKQARRYWTYYSPVALDIKRAGICNDCGKYVGVVESDHNPPLGPRPRVIEDFPDWWNRLMTGPQQGLCKKHHLEKSTRERNVRRKNKK